MDPFTIAAVVGGIGTAVSAVGQYSAMQAQAAQAKYKADLDRRNAAIVRNETQAAVEDKQRENQRVLGAVRAAYGNSGFDMAGSPLDVLQDQAAELALDTERIKYKGDIQARGLTESADMNDASAAGIKSAIPLSIAGIAIGGAKQTLSDWNKLN